MRIDEYFISIDENTDIPSKGKYSSKKDSFFEDILKYQNTTILKDYDIKPIQFTFEITNRCNCNCPNCGMSANNSNLERITLTEKKLFKLVDDLKTNGIISYAITGGEPFLEFDNICKMIKHANGKVDIIKLISNGFWGKDPKYYFDKLINAGLFDNEFITPSIYISIGEQSVKLEYICNLIKYVTDNFTVNELNFGIINTRHIDEDYSKLEQLFDLYVDIYGDFPNQKIYLTDSIYVNSNKFAKKKIETISNTVYNNIACCDNNFCATMGKFVSPKIFMKCNGDCYPCEVFNYHKDMYLGNYFIDGLENIIKNYNTNKYVLFIKKYGTVGFRDVIPKNVLKENHCETACQACEYCIKYCEKNNLLRM